MIAAAVALGWPSARLSAEEERAADVLELAIENHARVHMSRAGCEEPFDTTEKRSTVLAEVTRRLKKAGWIPQWQMVMRPSEQVLTRIVQVEPRGQTFVGWRLAGLGPTEAAYDEADRAALLASA